MKEGKISIPFLLRMVGAVVGSVGFLFLAYQSTLIGTMLIGIGSVLIAAGEG